jgi:phosphoserine aminotransferase
MKENASHKINFGSGPAALPREVLQEAAAAITNYNDTGLSILEIAHRGEYFDEILEESKALVKELCELGEEHEILWLPGGGRLQFCMVPMNFLSKEKTAGYIDSGAWAADAIQYASYYGNVSVLSSSKKENYTHLPEWPGNIPNDFAYLHFTTNNTIYGTQKREIPQTSAPLIADMSSDIFSLQREYKNCSLFYAVAQKNIGPAGATLVVIRKDLLKRQNNNLPQMLDYTQHIKKNSVLNTPPVFAIYVSLLMLRWTKKKTIKIIENESIQKSGMLYSELERNSLFQPVVSNSEDRSRMNICFTAKEKANEKAFGIFCEERGIVGIEGHRTVGGFRVSLYNAITIDAVKTFIDVMKTFEEKFGE